MSGTARFNRENGEVNAMEKYLKTGIKDVITQFPEIGKILEEYEIGCVPCAVGTCHLGEVVQIHNIPADQERELMARITKIIYPDREVVIPLLSKKEKKSGEIKYSPPVKKLVDEHTLIKRLLAMIPDLAAGLDLETDESRETLRGCVDFIRNYADKYHHAKEEDILFKNFDENEDIIKAMLVDHVHGREHVRGIIEAVESKNTAAAAEHLLAYRGLLSDHIRKEDEILYPWMERKMSTSDIGKLFTEFGAVDASFGDMELKYREFIEQLESKSKPAPALAAADR